MSAESLGQRETISTKYQIEPARNPKKAHAMVDRVMGDLPRNRLFATLHTFRKLKRNANREPDSFSLTDIPLARYHLDADNSPIEPTVGSFIVRGALSESRMGSFYTRDRVYRREDEGTELRGANYFVSLDKAKSLPTEKLDVIEKDFRDGLSVLEQVGRPQNEKEFLMYLGVLDYLKMHSLSLLHVLTYDERKGQITEEGSDRDIYLQVRQNAVDLMRASVRRFYQAASGLPFEKDMTLADMEAKMQSVVTYLGKNIKEEDGFKFTYPDINNPLAIMLGAHEASLQNPDSQTIVGLPSGGSESAVAAQLFYEITQGRSPDLAFLPISFHSKRRSTEVLDELTKLVGELYPGVFEGKSVLIIDDNSNTGKTVQTADTMVKALGATTTDAHLAEHDPQRVQRVIQKAQTPYGKAFNMEHQKYGTTMGVTSLTGRFRRWSEIEIYKRLDSYYGREPKYSQG